MDEKDLEREFTCGFVTITRSDYLNMPDMLRADQFSDAKMQRLAEAVNAALAARDDAFRMVRFLTTQKGYVNDWHSSSVYENTLELCALAAGMVKNEDYHAARVKRATEIIEDFFSDEMGEVPFKDDVVHRLAERVEYFIDDPEYIRRKGGE